MHNTVCTFLRMDFLQPINILHLYLLSLAIFFVIKFYLVGVVQIHSFFCSLYMMMCSLILLLVFFISFIYIYCSILIVLFLVWPIVYLFILNYLLLFIISSSFHTHHDAMTHHVLAAICMLRLHRPYCRIQIQPLSHGQGKLLRS